jgi:N-acetylneuraminic acid mutarotase
VEVYDPAADRWREGQRLPEPRCGFALAELGGDVYLFGGRESDDPSTASDKVWRYDPKLDSWSPDSDMPLARSDLAAVVEGRSIRLLGGLDETGEPQTNHWVFNPYRQAARWEMDDKPLPEGRAGLSAAATSVRNIHVVGGGWDRKLDDGTLVLRLSDPSAEWQADVPLPGFTPQKGAGMVVADNRVLVLAGGEVDGTPLDRHYRREVIRQLIFP